MDEYVALLTKFAAGQCGIWIAWAFWQWLPHIPIDYNLGKDIIIFCYIFCLIYSLIQLVKVIRFKI